MPESTLGISDQIQHPIGVGYKSIHLASLIKNNPRFQVWPDVSGAASLDVLCQLKFRNAMVWLPLDQVQAFHTWYGDVLA